MAWSWAFPMHQQNYVYTRSSNTTSVVAFPKLCFSVLLAGGCFHSSLQPFSGISCWTESAAQQHSVGKKKKKFTKYYEESGTHRKKCRIVQLKRCDEPLTWWATVSSFLSSLASYWDCNAHYLPLVQLSYCCFVLLCRLVLIFSSRKHFFFI